MTDTLDISMERLRVGLYVHLDLTWLEHPFAFNSFLIRDEDQIGALRSLGLDTVRYEPARSEALPLPENLARSVPGSLLRAPIERVSPILAAKRAMVEQGRRRQDRVERIAEAFIAAAHTLRGIDRNLVSSPGEGVKGAAHLVARISDSLLCAPELAIHVLGEKAGSEEVHFHPLNVAMLSLIVAREIGLTPVQAHTLGLGALFHDLGRRKIPASIFTKMDPLSSSERDLYRLHCEYGVDIGRELGLSSEVLAIIREHHEFFDGSGYPDGRQGEAIGLLSRIVVIANFYDELCNPPNVADGLTPHEALSAMYARLRSKFDPRLLQVFIRCLGVYPPGTVVQLSNGFIGMVATVNTAKPLKPMVLVYDPAVPREEAIMVDLEKEEDLNVAKAIRPGQLPREIYHYLSPRRRVSYYFDAPGPGQEGGGR